MNQKNKCLSLAEMTVESQIKLELSDGSFVIEQTFESFDPINCQIYWQSAYFLTDQFEFDRCPDHRYFYVTEE